MFNSFQSAQKNHENLDGNTFKLKYAKASKAAFLDVRTAAEFAFGTLPTATNLDVTSSQFQKALGTLDKDTEYFVFCHSGNRSGSAYDLMTAHRINAYNLAGGINAWPK